MFNKRNLCSLLLGGCMTVVTSSCAAKVGFGYRPYDSYHSDYHQWNDDEARYYSRWVIETNRPHREFRKLQRADQRAYWHWRHSH
jgi:hypothetical protein